MKLQIFDFDDTLFRTPPPNPNYIKKWYDLPVSLDPDKYSIHSIDTVAKIARDSHGDPKTKQVLITKRVPELTAQILYMLREYSIHLDKYFAIGHEANKPAILADLLSKDYKEIDFDEIEIYEDCLYQMLDYNQFFEALHYPKPIRVRYFFVDKTHLIEVPQTSLSGMHLVDKLNVIYP